MNTFGLHELEAVSAVASQRSFRGAAAHLQVSPSSLSYMIASVEKRLGIRLFQRNTRSVSLTEAGEMFLARVRPALREMADAIESVHDLRDKPGGQIRLNTSAWAADRVLPILLDFMRKFPDVKLDVVTEGRLVDIVADGFDAGLRFVEAVPREMIAVPLGVDEALIIVASPSYLAKHHAPEVPSDLLAHDCIRERLPSGALLRWGVEKGAEKAWVDVNGRLILGASGLTVRAAVGGAGVAYVEERQARPYLASGELVQLLADWTPPFAGICLYYPRQRQPSAALRAFIQHWKAQAKRQNPKRSRRTIPIYPSRAGRPPPTS